MPPIRFLMIGGFLGAGKTTAMAQIARHYLAQGKNVGLVTNDQADHLVDTYSLRAQGFHVGEVAGACFCCKFDDLVETIAQLSSEQRPDILLAEPVGSCTDLVATVLEPLWHLHGEQFDIGPLTVLCKPEHGRKILADESSGSGGGFSPKAAYLFLKQLEEADLIVVNKIDTMDAAEVEQLVELVRKRFPDKKILAASAKTGDGLDQLLNALEEPRPPSKQSLDIDYDTYAAGEAELGWLNGSLRLETVANDSARPFDLDEVVLDLVQRLARAFGKGEMETAHLKVLGMSKGGTTSIANLVSSDSRPELSLAAEVQVNEADLVINVRVAGDPKVLAQLVEEETALLAEERQLQANLGNLQHFRPGRPEPTHRR